MRSYCSALLCAALSWGVAHAINAPPKTVSPLVLHNTLGSFTGPNPVIAALPADIPPGETVAIAGDGPPRWAEASADFEQTTEVPWQ
jgi:hypothetical protein